MYARPLLQIGPSSCALIVAALLSSSAAGAEPLTLEQIMADPAWIGAPVEHAYFSVDGRAAYYSLKRGSSPIVDLHRVLLADGSDHVVDGAAMANADGPAVWDQAGKRAAFVRNGDVFVRDVAKHTLTQITRSLQKASSLQLSADGRIVSFRVHGDWFIYEVATGLTTQVGILKLEKDPAAPPKPDSLHDMQLRLFSTLQKEHADKETLRQYDEQQRQNDPTRAPAPFYLGDEIVVDDSALSPDGQWLLVVTSPKSAEKGRIGKLTHYVTESGYEELDDERVRVGRNSPAPQSLLLLNLRDHTIHPLATDTLPGIHDDPLKAIRALNAAPSPAAKTSGEPPARGVLIVAPDDAEATGDTIEWSRDGGAVAVELRAIDHKDRWIATVDLTKLALVSQHRLSDPAWVGWSFNEFGWLNDNRTLWYESEESGFGHLYIKSLKGGSAQPLTHGAFEVGSPTLSADGRWFYVLSNAEALYSYDVYRVPSSGGAWQRVTQLKGVEQFALSHDGKRLLLTHSSSYVPSQLAVANADGQGAYRELTDTRAPGYKAMNWLAPRIVPIPSSHFSGVIYAKLYGAPSASSAPRPAVLFVHGAGYLQDVHLQYPYYFREQLFHNLLVQHGYVVMVIDYRGSAGYGRDWRTAIYRQMGHPELEDLLDAKRWLVDHEHVDAHRVGIYGGSYGGFMTLMALFRAPGEFVAGAALRPVTDWAQYGDDYTSSILNTPDVDPLAYTKSSPIEYAAGLKDALLICHGVLDDNVLFEDAIRLYQRLIELHKQGVTLSPYALEKHSFTHADSWLDEYTRIFQLFESHLK